MTFLFFSLSLSQVLKIMSVSNGECNKYALQGSFIVPKGEIPIVPPPSMEYATSILSSQTLNLIYTVNPMTSLPGQSAIVPNNQGLILWYPKRGTGEIYHMGIVPAGSQSYRDGAVKSNITVPSLTDNISQYRNSIGVTTPQRCGVGRFLYSKALALPRRDSQMNLTPDLSKEFSLAKTFQGRIRGSCKSIGQLVTQFNGLWSAAVFADSRDVAQNTDGTDCFSVQDMEAFSAGAKESTVNVPLMDDIVLLQGANIEEKFESPNALNHIQTDGGYAFVPPLSTGERTVEINMDNTLANGYYQINLFNGWYSPNGVQLEDSFNNIVTPAGNLLYSQGLINGGNQAASVIPPLSEGGIVEVDFNIGCYFKPSTIPNPAFGASELQFHSVVEHYFAFIEDSTSGELGYNVLRTTRSTNALPYNMQAAGISTIRAAPILQIGHRSNIQGEYVEQGGMKNLGKFIGCRVYACVSVNWLVLGPLAFANLTVTSEAPPSFSNEFILPQSSLPLPPNTAPSVTIYSRDANLHDAVGPVHVARYDNVGTSQMMVFTGLSNVQVVPKGSVMKYTKQQIGSHLTSSDVDFFPALSNLYKGKNEYSMVYSGTEYDRMCYSQVGPMTGDHVARLQESDPNVGVSLHNLEVDKTVGPGMSLVSNSRRDRNDVVTSAGAGAQFGSGARYTSASQFGAAGSFQNCDRNISALGNFA